MKRDSLLFAAAGTAALSLVSQSIEAAGPSADVRASEEPGAVIVTATRYPVPRDEVLPASIVIERDVLERSLAPDIADVLRFHTGLEFGRNGGPGQLSSLFMRGTDGNHTLVLVDGVRINPATLGGAALQNISPELVQRIEVVKGPRSTLYGSDAIGGVVQIFTRARSAQGWSSHAGFGAHDTMAASTSGGWGSDAAHVGFGLNYLQTDGFAPRKIDARGGAYDNLSFNLAGSAQLKRGDLAATYLRSAGSADYIGFSGRSFDNALITQDYANEAGSVSYGWELGAWSSKLEIGRMVDDLDQGRVRDSQGEFESEDFATTRRNSVGWQNDIDVNGHNRLSVGAMYYGESADTLSFGRIDTGVANIYLQERLALERHTLIAAAGYVDHEAFGGHATWNGEYGLQLTDATRLVASAGTAFRAPDATDRYGFGGNPDLAPEESLNYELGLRFSVGERQRISLSAFQNDIDELITFVVLDFDTFEGQMRNIDRVRIRGIEAGYEVTGAQWRLRAEAIYQEPEDRTSGTQLVRRAKENFTLSYAHSFGPVELGADLLAAGKRDDFGGELDSYLLANLTARYDIGAGWSAQARIENLLDQEYELARGYNTQDRSMFVALRYSGRP